MDISKIVDKEQLNEGKEEVRSKKLPKLASEGQQSNTINTELPSLLNQVRQGGQTKVGSGGDVTMGLNVQSGPFDNQQKMNAGLDKSRNAEKYHSQKSQLKEQPLVSNR